MISFSKATGLPQLILSIACFIILMIIISIPVSTAGQGLLSIIAVITVAILKPFAHSIVPRFFLLATASIIVLRYFTWRMFDTLPDLGLTISFITGMTLLVVEGYSIMVFFLNAFLNADPTHSVTPPAVPPAELPTVDILVPSYNESTEMLSVTLAAAKNMIYPSEKMTVTLCDDGGTDQRCNDDDPYLAEEACLRRTELQLLCENLGVRYATRELNERAKAGNMSSALEKLNGDLVAVFDADHVPTRDFLAYTITHFVSDPELFLVQTPHFFLNKDPIQRNLELSEKCPPENEVFYGMIHRGLDRWGGAFFCGSAAVLRREALDDVGGFAGETITEDAETALEIHSSGWKSIFINRAMIAGLQPETFSSFIQQRGRWATGMMQMLFLKNPLFRRGLSIPQRICYINSMSFWLFPLMRLFYLLVPLVYLLFGVEILKATFEDVLVYMIGYLTVSFLVQNAIFSRFRWPLISEVYEVAQAPYLARAVIRTMLRPRGAKFNVTAKDETLDQDFISPVHWPLTLLFLAMLMGVIALVVRWYIFPGDRGVLTVVGGWAIFNLMLVSIAYRAVAEKQQRRIAPRVRMNVPGRVWLPENCDAFCNIQIHDVSINGASIFLSSGQSLPVSNSTNTLHNSQISLKPSFIETPHLEFEIKASVRSIQETPKGKILGVLFDADQPVSARETVAHLIFGDSDKWDRTRANTSTPKGLLAGLGYVVWLFISGTPKLLNSLISQPIPLKTDALKNSVASKREHLLALATDPENSKSLGLKVLVDADTNNKKDAETNSAKLSQPSGAS